MKCVKCALFSTVSDWLTTGILAVWGRSNAKPQTFTGSNLCHTGMHWKKHFSSLQESQEIIPEKVQTANRQIEVTRICFFVVDVPTLKLLSKNIKSNQIICIITNYKTLWTVSAELWQFSISAHPLWEHVHILSTERVKVGSRTRVYFREKLIVGDRHGIAGGARNTGAVPCHSCTLGLGHGAAGVRHSGTRGRWVVICSLCGGRAVGRQRGRGAFPEPSV